MVCYSRAPSYFLDSALAHIFLITCKICVRSIEKAFVLSWRCVCWAISEFPNIISDFKWLARTILLLSFLLFNFSSLWIFFVLIIQVFIPLINWIIHYFVWCFFLLSNTVVRLLFLYLLLIVLIVLRIVLSDILRSIIVWLFKLVIIKLLVDSEFCLLLAAWQLLCERWLCFFTEAKVLLLRYCFISKREELGFVKGHITLIHALMLVSSAIRQSIWVDFPVRAYYFIT